MSHSPTDAERTRGSNYESGWIAIHRMLREGASWSGREKNVAFVNLDGLEFADVSHVSGLDHADDARAVCVTDWDLDGALDLVQMSRTAPRVRVLRNRMQAGPFLALRLVGQRANRDAIGARVDLDLSSGRTLARTLRAGDGYLAQSSKWLHFGYVEGEEITKLSVRWPNGEVQEVAPDEFPGQATRARWSLEQGAAPTPFVVESDGGLTAAPFEPPASSEKARTTLSARLPMPELRATRPSGVPIEVLSASQGRPVLLLVWASWCKPCLEELRAFTEAIESVRATGVVVVALNVDDDEAWPEANRFLREIRWPYEVVRGDEQLVDVLDVVQRSVLERRRRLPLPSAFLIDAKGRLAKIYKGGVTPSDLSFDTLRLDSPDARIRDASLPFAGRWRATPARADRLGLEARLRKAGLEDVARAYYARWFADNVETSSTTVAQTHLRRGLGYMRQRKLEFAVRSLRIAVSLDAQLFDAWSNLAIILHKQGNLPKAIEAYETALEIQPDHAFSAFNLGIAFADSGDLDRARKQVEALRELDPAIAERLEKDLDGRE